MLLLKRNIKLAALQINRMFDPDNSNFVFKQYKISFSSFFYLKKYP